MPPQKKVTRLDTSRIKIILKKTPSEIVFLKATSHVPSKVPETVSAKSGLDSVLLYMIRKGDCTLIIMYYILV